MYVVNWITAPYSSILSIRVSHMNNLWRVFFCLFVFWFSVSLRLEYIWLPHWYWACCITRFSQWDACWCPAEELWSIQLSTCLLGFFQALKTLHTGNCLSQKEKCGRIQSHLQSATQPHWKLIIQLRVVKSQKLKTYELLKIIIGDRFWGCFLLTKTDTTVNSKAGNKIQFSEFRLNTLSTTQ